VFDRRRGGAENLGSTRRISKWLNNRPNKFTRRASDINNDDVSKCDSKPTKLQISWKFH